VDALYTSPAEMHRRVAWALCMRNIYQKAIKTIIWLSYGNNDIEAGIDCLNEFKEEYALY